MKPIGKDRIFFSHIQMKRFNNLIFELAYKGTFQPGCQLELWCQEENILRILIPGYWSKCSHKLGGMISFCSIKVYWLDLDVSN